MRCIVSDALSTASINSTILEYRKLHGRTFHVFGGVDYWGPNDDMQLNGQDVKCVSLCLFISTSRSQVMDNWQSPHGLPRS